MASFLERLVNFYINVRVQVVLLTKLDGIMSTSSENFPS